MAEAIFNDRFILTSPQDVQHDNSLSGNGTVNSPLGVVPGYNETVLWSGTCTSGSTATISENVSGFERIRMECYCHNGIDYSCYAEAPVKSNNVSLVGVSFWPGEVDFTEAKIVNTTLTCYGTIILSPAQGNKFKGTVTKIWGINRKQ